MERDLATLERPPTEPMLATGAATLGRGPIAAVGPMTPEARLPMPLEDESSRREFVDEHYRRLYGWLWWLTGSTETAADLTQDAFAAFWSSLDRVPVRRPRTWLYQIARNRWRKWCRDERTGRRGDEHDPASALREPVDDAVRAEAVRRLAGAVEELPRAYREAVTLRYWGDLSYREIGSVLGITAALARWRVFRAQRLLRDRIEEPPTTMGGAP
jgi:RNA polymerase sigma-70 factor (ECF subfamily)